MYDEDTDTEPKIVSASFADPYLLSVRDDSSIYVAQCGDDFELEEVERDEDALVKTRWLTGCLYADSKGVFSSGQPIRKKDAVGDVFMFLLSANGALHVSLLK